MSMVKITVRALVRAEGRAGGGIGEWRECTVEEEEKRDEKKQTHEEQDEKEREEQRTRDIHTTGSMHTVYSK